MMKQRIRHPLHRDDLDRHELDDEVVFYDNAFNTTYRLNATGYFIWKSCDGRTGVADIATRLASEYDAPEPQLNADVADFVIELHSQGLLVHDTPSQVAPTDDC